MIGYLIVWMLAGRVVRAFHCQREFDNRTPKSSKMKVDNASAGLIRCAPAAPGFLPPVAGHPGVDAASLLVPTQAERLEWYSAFPRGGTRESGLHHLALESIAQLGQRWLCSSHGSLAWFMT